MSKNQCVKSKEQKISCMLFSCPLIEEKSTCTLSSFRLLTSNQKFWIEERAEQSDSYRILKAKFMCLNVENKNS